MLFHVQWSNVDGSGMRYLRSMWPAVDRAMEQGVRGSDPDDDGLFTGFYEYWDNDVKRRCFHDLRAVRLAKAKKHHDFSTSTVTWTTRRRCPC